MAMSTGGGGGAISDINVTPLVDVMLVLLIIFMVATPIITKAEQERQVDINLPVTRENPNVVDLSNTEKLILKIDANLRVYVGEELITDCSAATGKPDPKAYEPCFTQLQEKLGANERLRQEQSLYLLADTSIPYGFVVGSMNRIRLAGVQNVGMVTNPEYLVEQQKAGPAPASPGKGGR